MQITRNLKYPVCLLSDCDGVIVDSEGVADAIMFEVLHNAFKSDALEEEMADLFGNRVVDIIMHLEKKLGMALTSEQRSRMHQEIDTRVAQEAPAMPDVKLVYESLGLPVAIVSNSAPARLHQCVQRAGLADLVGNNIFSGDEVKSPKPAPDVYLKAASAMGFLPQQCVVVEDSVTGVTAVRTAGMQVLGFLGGSHVRPSHIDLLTQAGARKLFDKMTDLPIVIQSICA